MAIRNLAIKRDFGQMKLLSVIIFLAISILAFGCSKKSAKEERVILRYSYFGSGKELSLMKEVTDAFEAKHPSIEVKVINVSGHRSYYDKLQIILAGGSDVDVIVVGGPILPTYMAKGVLLDLGKYAEKDEEFTDLKKDFWPGLLEKVCTYEGHLYALPRVLNPLVIYYNKDLFDEVGLNYPDERWTWEIFLEACKKLTKDLNGDGRIDQFGFIVAPDHYLVFVRENEGKAFSDDKRKCLLGSPQAVEAIQWHADLINKYHVSPSIGEVRPFTEDSLQAFSMGKIGMIVLGRWGVSWLRQVKGLRWDVAHVPRGKRRTTIVISSGWAIPKGTKHPQEAWELAKHFAGPVAQRIFAAGQDVPVLMSVANSDIFLSPGLSPEHGRVFLEAMEYGDFHPFLINFYGISQLISQRLELVYLGNEKAEKVCRKIIVPEINKLLVSED